MSIHCELPSVLERYELKYVIPLSWVEAISDFISPYCALDYHSESAENHFYAVNSLYLDTPNFQFLQQRLYGKDARFNMRVRSYADGESPPYFMEIKHKNGNVVKKYRATAHRGEWPDILSSPHYRIDEKSPLERRNKELFLRLYLSYAVEPKIFTRYRRRAFFSTVDEYARVTMDVSMSYRLQDDFNLKPDERMTPYDNSTIYAGNTPETERCVVLELKCNAGAVPAWMLDLIAFFQLNRQGFSKYMNSALTALVDDGFHYMSGDRISAYHC